jgi:gamma-glutamyltranspeptidase/glutathione hydrolase
MKNVARISGFMLLVAVLASCATSPADVSVSAADSMPVQGPLRPPVIGRNAGVSAGHPLTTAAALEILLQGGNAFDAGVAALLVGGVVEQDLYGIGGEALILSWFIRKTSEKSRPSLDRDGQRRQPTSMTT